VGTAEQALKGATLVWQDVGGNLALELSTGFGEVDAAFAEAEITVEERYTFARRRRRHGAAGCRGGAGRPRRDSPHPVGRYSSAPHRAGRRCCLSGTRAEGAARGDAGRGRRLRSQRTYLRRGVRGRRAGAAPPVPDLLYRHPHRRPAHHRPGRWTHGPGTAGCDAEWPYSRYRPSYRAGRGGVHRRRPLGVHEYHASSPGAISRAGGSNPGHRRLHQSRHDLAAARRRTPERHLRDGTPARSAGRATPGRLRRDPPPELHPVAGLPLRHRPPLRGWSKHGVRQRFLPHLPGPSTGHHRPGVLPAGAGNGPAAGALPRSWPGRIHRIHRCGRGGSPAAPRAGRQGCGAGGIARSGPGTRHCLYSDGCRPPGSVVRPRSTIYPAIPAR